MGISTFPAATGGGGGGGGLQAITAAGGTHNLTLAAGTYKIEASAINNYPVTIGTTDITATDQLFSLASSASSVTFKPLVNGVENQTQRTTAMTGGQYGIAYGDGLFVAMTSNSPNPAQVQTSTNGINWTLRNASATSYMDAGMAYGNGLFASAGRSGRIMTSPNGITWTNRSSGHGGDFYYIAYVGGKFFALSTDYVSLSSDGTTWTRYYVNGNYMSGIAYGNGVYVIVASNSVIRVSADGTSWGSASGSISSNWNGIAFMNGLFVAVGSGGYIMTSPDGTNWTTRASGTSTQLKGVEAIDGLLLAVGYSGVMVTSTDGASWSSLTPATSSTLDEIAYGGDLVVVNTTNQYVVTLDTIAATTENALIIQSTEPIALT
ncbi:hypothetical protein N9262_02340 [Akkermansiaceae bacterium]|nr:hypothetical protein [Akkermansiaceae bacterium]